MLEDLRRADHPLLRGDRTRGAGGLVLALCLLVGGCGGDEEPAPPELSLPATRPSSPLAHDPRVDYLLVPGQDSGHFDLDTSDPVQILVATLTHGGKDPQKRAREELAAMGEVGLQAARRMIDAAWNRPYGDPDVRNAMDVVSLSDHPGARLVAARVLENPSESIRMLAVRALRKHGSPAEYDAAFEAFEQSSSEFRLETALILYRLDPLRAELQYTQWMTDGQWQPLWEALGTELSAAVDPTVVARCRALWPEVPMGLQPVLAAPCARAGDSEALEALREWSRDERDVLRRMALQAFSQAELLDEIPRSIREDPSTELRLFALGLLSTPERIERFRPLFEAAMISDPQPRVSLGAMTKLVELGDPDATERALSLLSSGELIPALRMLRPRLREGQGSQELCRRVFERLLVMDSEVEHRTLAERTPVLQAIGQIPLPEAARLLYEASRELSGETIAGLRGERWCILQIANGHEVGSRFLREMLETEREPLRRLDLLEALSAPGRELTREALIPFVDGDDVDPYEVLFVADKLAGIGPAARIAPLLKRVTLRVQQPDVRRALQGLLWRTYPRPRELEGN